MKLHKHKKGKRDLTAPQFLKLTEALIERLKRMGRRKRQALAKYLKGALVDPEPTDDDEEFDDYEDD